MSADARVESGWSTLQLRAVASVISGYPFPSDAFGEHGVPIVRIRDLNERTATTRYSGPVVPEVEVNRSDALVGMDGHFAVGRWLGAEPAYLNQRVCCVRGNDEWTCRFLYYAIGQPLKTINDLTWATTVKHLAVGQVRRLQLRVPPNDQLPNIVRFLENHDLRLRRAESQKRGLIDHLDERRRAIAQAIVTRGVESSGASKPSGIEWLGEVPLHWDIRPAKFLFREVDDRSVRGEEELMSVSHITGVTTRASKNITMFQAADYTGHKLCRPGDVVINTMWAWMGALGVAHDTGIVSPAYGVYRPLPDSPLTPEYADLLLRTRPYIDEYTCRSTGIQSSRLRLYPGPLPARSCRVPAARRAARHRGNGSRGNRSDRRSHRGHVARGRIARGVPNSPDLRRGDRAA